MIYDDFNAIRPIHLDETDIILEVIKAMRREKVMHYDDIIYQATDMIVPRSVRNNMTRTDLLEAVIKWNKVREYDKQRYQKYFSSSLSGVVDGSGSLRS